MRWFIGAYVAVVLLLGGFAAVGAAVLVDARPSDPAEAAADRYGFNLITWEFRHFPEKWLYRIGDMLRDNGKGEDDDHVLQRYFNLTRREDRLQLQDPDSSELDAMENERAFLENSVEDIIEGRITSIIEDQRLTAEPPLFSDLGVVFPPVDFEFDQPPRVLVTSPREKIELRSDDLLTPGLTLDTVEQIERDAESDGSISALVVQSGGVATYPSVIDNLDDYGHVIEIVSHEWTHQYLAFYPLGARYFSGSELRTLNETVASISGKQLAALYFEKYGELNLTASDPPPATPAPTLAAGAHTPAPFDFTMEMRALRVQVEELLAVGKFGYAETVMQQKRDEFAERGYFIRRLNQAYFSFYGFYATGPGSIDPIGPKMEQLLEESGSPGALLRLARAFTSVSDLDEALTSR
jgi:hypothetical protein